ncbi:MAG TPA: choice-of-anchor P family protein, partial [Actinomycetota bacterium]
MSASAFGILGPSASSGPLAMPEPGGVSGMASDPSVGFGPLVASAQLIGLPGVLTVDDVEASASGVINAATQDRMATAAGSVDGLVLAGGLVKAVHLSTTCTSNKDGSSGSAFLDGLTIGGIAVGISPAANTVVGIPGVLRAVLNEQVVDDSPGSTGIVVRAVDLQVLPDNQGRAALELILAESRCGTKGSTAATIPTRPPVRLGTVPRGPTPPPGTKALPPTLPPSPGGGTALPVTGAVTPAVPAVPSGTASATPSPAPSGPGGSGGPPPQAGAGSGSALPATSFAPVVTPPNGPPGAQVRVVASGYGSCQEVGVSFNGVRIGSARP